MPSSKAETRHRKANQSTTKGALPIIPNELLLAIWTMTNDVGTIVRCGAVCRSWKYLLHHSDGVVWPKLLPPHCAPTRLKREEWEQVLAIHYSWSRLLTPMPAVIAEPVLIDPNSADPRTNGCDGVEPKRERVFYGVLRPGIYQWAHAGHYTAYRQNEGDQWVVVVLNLKDGTTRRMKERRDTRDGSTICRTCRTNLLCISEAETDGDNCESRVRYWDWETLELAGETERGPPAVDLAGCGSHIVALCTSDLDTPGIVKSWDLKLKRAVEGPGIKVLDDTIAEQVCLNETHIAYIVRWHSHLVLTLFEKSTEINQRLVLNFGPRSTIHVHMTRTFLVLQYNESVDVYSLQPMTRIQTVTTRPITEMWLAEDGSRMLSLVHGKDLMVTDPISNTQKLYQWPGNRKWKEDSVASGSSGGSSGGSSDGSLNGAPDGFSKQDGIWIYGRDYDLDEAGRRVGFGVDFVGWRYDG